MDQNKISEFIDKALLLVGGGAKEYVVTSNLSSYLRSMFPENPLWVEHYFNGIETAVTLYKTKTSGASSGSIDVFVNGTVIEFERDLSHGSIYSHGLAQVKDYCAGEIRKGFPINKLIGVLSDTLLWEFYSIEPVPGLPASAYTSSSIVLKPEKRIQITSSDNTTAFEFGSLLETYFGRKEARTLTAQNLYEDFGLDTPMGRRYINDCSLIINSLSAKKPAYFTMIQNLWESFVEGLDKSISGSTDSYTIEFYIATLAKLLCANIFEGHALLSNKDELIDLISGKYFLRKGYLNFIEYDYFGWINEHLKGSLFMGALEELQKALSIYDYSSEPSSDIFGNLLSQLSLKTKRILLGQELTPSWLSEELVNSVYTHLPKGTWPRFIDMCCGSGSMIVATINLCSSILSHSSSVDEEQQYSIIENCALGIDIDPLAVLLAKANWIIHTKKYCRSKTEIVIPIYHADSLFISSPVSSGASSLTLSFDGNTVLLPKFLLNYQYNEFFSILIERIANAIDSPVIDFSLLINSIIEDTDVSFSSSEISDTETFARNLHSILYSLHTHGRNGIWAFLLKNSFKPALITRKFNGIVSNTPWMTLSQVSNNPYRDSLNTISKGYKVFPGDSSSLHSEIATVFLLHSIDSFLEDNAPYGCILPRSVLNGKQHDKFRSNISFPSSIPCSIPFSITPTELWDLPSETFNNRAIALIGKKTTSSSSTGPFTHRLYSPDRTYTSGNMHIISLGGRIVWSLKAPSAKHIHKVYSFEQGADILPRTFFYFDLKVLSKNIEINPLILNRSSYGHFLKDGKEPYKSYTPPTARIPKYFFKKTIVSNAVLPFVVTDFPLALIPYTKDTATNRWRRFNSAELAALPSPVSATLQKLSSDYSSLVGESRDLYGDSAFNIRNKVVKQSFTADRYLVVCGAGGANIAAAYIKLDSSNKDILVDQTLYYHQVESEEEALYLVGLLNSNILNQTIKTFQPAGIKGQRHVHSLPYPFIPKFDALSTDHQELVMATKSLIQEINTLISSGAINNLVDPNAAPLISRRPKYSLEIEKLPSFLDYDRCCNTIII